ncbi:MAG: aminotransferase class III-fold pyridoxal phosphate-dependent enzyme [Dehalococcoidales bacterium]
MTTAREVFEEQYISRTKKSRQMYEEARHYLAGGVPGGARYRRPYPVYVKEARGSKLWDVDGNEYIDLLMGAGPAILGHSPPSVMKAVKEQLDRGTIMQVTGEFAVELAKKITKHMPGMELIRFVNSGSEAVHIALRAARAYTGRDKYAKFEGSYNGQLDNVLVSGDVYGGPEDAPESVPASAGIPKSILDETIVLPWNNAEAAVSLIKKHAKELAAVLIDPVGGIHLGGIPAEKSLVQALREVTEKEGIILIFDEVISGFRMGLSGGYSLSGVVPDMRSLGKIIGGGFPVGAYGGRRDIMEKVVAPPDPAEAKNAALRKQKIFSSGTYSGNPISMVAGLATIKELEKPGFYEHIDGCAERVRSGLPEIASDMGLDIQVVGVRSLFSVHFTSRPLKNVRDILGSDRETAGVFYTGLVANGVYIPEHHFGVISGAHTNADIDKILSVSEIVLKEIRKRQA